MKNLIQLSEERIYRTNLLVIHIQIFIKCYKSQLEISLLKFVKFRAYFTLGMGPKFSPQVRVGKSLYNASLIYFCIYAIYLCNYIHVHVIFYLFWIKKITFFSLLNQHVLNRTLTLANANFIHI